MYSIHIGLMKEMQKKLIYCVLQKNFIQAVDTYTC